MLVIVYIIMCWFLEKKNGGYMLYRNHFNIEKIFFYDKNCDDSLEK